MIVSIIKGKAKDWKEIFKKEKLIMIFDALKINWVCLISFKRFDLQQLFLRSSLFFVCAIVDSSFFNFISSPPPSHKIALIHVIKNIGISSRRPF